MGDTELYYQALLARDYRFDGKFFVAVKTTGIYCRPICPARPKRENVVFFATRSLAEKAGYRPCLRCRPECAPSSPAWNGKSAVVQRALKVIANHASDGLKEDAFAEQFGMTARHLRRIFQKELGQTPKQIYDNNRLNLARTLIVETKLPVTVVAETVGFGSLRRFNDAFKKRFTKAPTQLRRKAGKDETGIELDLPFRPPYPWRHLLGYYESHRIPGIEVIRDEAYERVFKLGSDVGWLRVRAADTSVKLNVVVSNPKVLLDIVGRVKRMFDLDCDPLLIGQQLSRSPLLAALYEKDPGLRLPGGWDPFETAVGTILGQLVSVEHARALLSQLVEHYGESVPHPITREPTKLFPTATAIAQSDLARVRTTAARRASMRELSRRVSNGELSFSEAQDPARFREQLQSVRGLGPWSAEYISLRAIGDTDAFPKTDLILRRVLELHPQLNLDAMKPWRSYAAMYLWKGFAKSLSKRKEKTP